MEWKTINESKIETQNYNGKIKAFQLIHKYCNEKSTKELEREYHTVCVCIRTHIGNCSNTSHQYNRPIANTDY